MCVGRGQWWDEEEEEEKDFVLDWIASPDK